MDGDIDIDSEIPLEVSAVFGNNLQNNSTKLDNRNIKKIGRKMEIKLYRNRYVGLHR